MSLKVVHVVFISLSSLLAFGFGALRLRDYGTGGGFGSLGAGLASLAIGAGLIAYGIWFLRKVRRLR